MTTLEDELRSVLRTHAQALRVPEPPALDRRIVEPHRRPGPRWLAAAACLALTLAGVVALAQRQAPNSEPAPPVASVVPDTTASAPIVNGWLVVGGAGAQEGSGLSLIRPGDVDGRRIQVPGSETAEEPCPAWSPDGTRLMFGSATSSTPGELSSDTTFSDAELVILDVDRDGEFGDATVIPLEGFDAFVCGIWAPDGRWVALADPSGVWVIDTQTAEHRRLPDVRPVDLEWRPGTDQLTIAGDLGTTWQSAPVSIYTVSTGEFHQLGTVEAAEITWSPDGSTLAYRGGPSTSSELWLVDADGTDQRLLVADTGENNHGIGPVWSPAGGLIAYQRLCCGRAETHEVVLVHVTDGTETSTQLVADDGKAWWPYNLTWSPDGTMLVGNAWSDDLGSRLFVVAADAPDNLTVFADATAPFGFETVHRGAMLQMWGRG